MNPLVGEIRLTVCALLSRGDREEFRRDRYPGHQCRHAVPRAVRGFPVEKWEQLLATKGAIKNLTRGMCCDWAKHGPQINAIAPGYFKTPLNQALVDNPEFSSWLEKRTPAGRWGNVEELVGEAVFLSGKASSFINGHALHVDGGITTSWPPDNCPGNLLA
jgi:NAD(P)-dependent dehydrogenase (short-subunit alcohol dehydrogenase family)